MASTIFIYGLLDSRIEQIRYVGRSISPVLRMKAHITNALFQHRRDNKLGGKEQWIVELSSEDLEPELVILEEVKDGPVSANESEAQWILRLLEDGHPLTNIRLPEDLRENKRALEDARERGREMFSGPVTNAEMLRGLRVRKMLTQQDLSSAAGISLGQLNRIERGRINNPHAKTVEALAGVLGVDAERFYST